MWDFWSLEVFVPLEHGSVGILVHLPLSSCSRPSFAQWRAHIEALSTPLQIATHWPPLGA